MFSNLGKGFRTNEGRFNFGTDISSFFPLFFFFLFFSPFFSFCIWFRNLVEVWHLVTVKYEITLKVRHFVAERLYGPSTLHISFWAISGVRSGGLRSMPWCWTVPATSAPMTFPPSLWAAAWCCWTVRWTSFTLCTTRIAARWISVLMMVTVMVMMRSPAVPSFKRLHKLRPPFAEIPELSKILSLKPLAKLKCSHHCIADNTALISSRQAKPWLDRRASRCWSSLAGICVFDHGASVAYVCHIAVMICVML